MRILISIFLVFQISIIVAESQIVNRWANIDGGKGVYGESSRTKILSALSTQKLISLDQEFANTSPLVKYTTTGGAQWDTVFKSNIAFEYGFNSLAYPADKYMYVVGDTILPFFIEKMNYNYVYQAMILSSYDNGETWNKILFDTNSYITYLDMSDSITGIASKRIRNNKFNTVPNYGDTIIWTNDGFRTFEKIAFPIVGFTIGDLKCIDENTFIVNVNNKTQEIYKYIITHDRGVTWEDMFETVGIISMDILSENVAFVIQRKPNSSDIEIKRTLDGGKSWELCNIPEIDINMCKISAADEDNVMIGSSNAVLYISNDGGKSWVQEYMPYGVSGGVDLRYDYITTVEYVDKNTAFAITNGERLYSRTDDKILTRPKLKKFDDLIAPFEIEIDWGKVEGALSYQYQLAISKSSVFSYSAYDDLVLDTIIESNHITLPDMEYGKCYYARIKAIGDNIESEWYLGPIQFCTFVDSTYISTPKFILPTPGATIGGKEPKFIWTSIPEATKYDFQINVIPDFSYYVLFSTTTSDTFYVYSEETPLPNTLLAARVRVNDGVHLSNWRYISFFYDETVGVWDLVKNNSMLIYPNPASDFINISIDSDEGLLTREVQILNLLGLVVSKQELTDGNNRIDISNLPRGTYFIKIGDKVEKFVKM